MWGIHPPPPPFPPATPGNSLTLMTNVLRCGSSPVSSTRRCRAPPTVPISLYRLKNSSPARNDVLGGVAVCARAGTAPKRLVERCCNSASDCVKEKKVFYFNASRRNAVVRKSDANVTDHPYPAKIDNLAGSPYRCRRRITDIARRRARRAYG